MPLVEARHLDKTYTIDGRTMTVIADVSLSIESGEFVAVTGASGSGKTTLLTLLSGLDRPSRGSVRIDGRDITHASEDGLAGLRNRFMGFVFQSFHLIPSLTAMENVMFPAELCNDPQAAANARRLLFRVGLADRAGNLPGQLSGGEKQRVALCRAMINRPRLLFADEPTGNLDSANGRRVLELLLALRVEENATLVMVTHNPDLAQAAGRVLTLADGRLAG